MLRILAIIIFTLTFTSQRIYPNDYQNKYNSIDSLLREFDTELSKREHYTIQKSIHTRALNHEYTKLDDIEKKIYINEKLLEEYINYNYDTALYYVNRNLDLLSRYPNKQLLIKNQLYLCNLYILNGIYWEVEPILKSINLADCTPKQKIFVYEAWARFSYYLHYSVVSKANKQKYLNRFLASMNQLMEYDPSLENVFPDIRLFYYYEMNNFDGIESVCDSILSNASTLSRKFVLALEWKSIVAYMKEDTYKGIYYLILGSIYEQRNLIKNGRPTYILTKRMFEYQCVKKAHQYIKIVHEDANICNSLIHKARSSDLTALINEKHENEIERHHRKMHRNFVIIAILSTILIGITTILIIQMRKLSRTKNKLITSHNKQLELNEQLNLFNNTLMHTNSIKEEYLGMVLQMRPYYIENLNSHRKQILRLVKERKFQEVYEYCKSDHSIADEYEKSHKEFDKMFLDIYPEFVERFNSLLNEEARTEPKNGELTIEMRIFALIRLGVNDSAKIASYLHYSVNTIYNYRSRTKLKALVPREDFEAEVKKIGCSLV